MSIILGAIADDFTGATDLASMLCQGGMQVKLVNNVPESDLNLDDADAVVVALKTRTIPAKEAVEQSVTALRWLRKLGARQYFFKYCSTFDSTAEGNIGPVSDALQEELNTTFSIVCPAFPGNQRTVYMGHLFVGNRLLSDSSMKDHPLTPMTRSDLVELMSEQSSHEVGLIPHRTVRSGVEAVRSVCDSLISGGYRYGVVDGVSNSDLEVIGASVADHALLTGGSGVALGLPSNYRAQGWLGKFSSPVIPEATGKRMVLAGSCSVRTREQIRAVMDHWPSRKIHLQVKQNPSDYADELIGWAADQDSLLPVLLHTSADPDEVRENQRRFGRDRAGQWIEELVGAVAVRAVGIGYRQFIVAGGETSGAVVKALNIRAMSVGKEIEPGVPWTETMEEPGIALALKSGNFGGVDFFEKSFSMLP